MPFERGEELVLQAIRQARQRPAQPLAHQRELLFGEPAVVGPFVHLGRHLLHQARNADHEELVEVGPVDRDELEAFEQRVPLVQRLFEDALVELQPRRLAIDVERGIVEGDRWGHRRGAELGADLRTGEHDSSLVRHVSADFFAHLISHVVLAGAALLVAATIGIPLAGRAVDRPLPRGVLLALAGGFRVVPSLAVLTLTIPFLGLGFAPALLALVVLALPPILVNTDVALRSVPKATLESARGMGMTERQVGTRVRWPLALPVVAVGVRTATVEVIASATLAAFIGGGGLGDYIVSGLQTGNFPELVLGAASVAVLAILADAALGFTQRRLALSLSPTSG